MADEIITITMKYRPVPILNVAVETPEERRLENRWDSKFASQRTAFPFGKQMTGRGSVSGAR